MTMSLLGGPHDDWPTAGVGMGVSNKTVAISAHLRGALRGHCGWRAS